MEVSPVIKTSPTSSASALVVNQVASPNDHDGDRANRKLQSVVIQTQQQKSHQLSLVASTNTTLSNHNGDTPPKAPMVVTIPKSATDMAFNGLHEASNNYTTDANENNYGLDIRNLLEHLLETVILALPVSNNNETRYYSEQNDQKSLKMSHATNVLPDKGVNNTSTNFRDDNFGLEPVEGRHVSLSPDEASGDLVIDSDLPSSAGPQENSDDTEQADSSSQDEKNFSLKVEKECLVDKSSNTHNDLITKKRTESDPTTQSTTPHKQTSRSLLLPFSKREPEIGSPSKSDDKLVLKSASSLASATDSRDIAALAISTAEPEDLQDEKEKDIVALRNLEITPPPATSEEISESTKEKTETFEKTPPTANPQKGKRKKTSSVSESKESESNEPSESSGRSKRQRTQTKLFQAGDVSYEEDFELPDDTPKKPRTSRASGSRPRRSTGPSPKPQDEPETTSPDLKTRTNEQQDVIFYEKNDYLAIRNEENSYYICQLMENVRSNRPMIKVKWLDTTDSGKTYFLTSQYDKIPQKSIIMPVTPNKLKSGKKGEQLFSIDEQVKDNITERLKRSISVVTPSTAV